MAQSDVMQVLAGKLIIIVAATCWIALVQVVMMFVGVIRVRRISRLVASVENEARPVTGRVDSLSSDVSRISLLTKLNAWAMM